MLRHENLNPFAIAQAQLDTAAERLKLDKGTWELLRWPMKEIHLTFPVRMDDGTVKIFHGFRVQYNGSRGPCKGGIRFHPSETIDTVRALAAWMTWKTSVVDIPLGGGKGGVICNPKELTVTELERLSRAYIRAIGNDLGVMKDVPAPDVYTTPQIMGWMMDEFETLHQVHHPGVITGKPLALGGSQGRPDATARGGLYVLREAAAKLGLDPKTCTYAIQGLGNVGGYAAQILDEEIGGKIVALGEIDGALVNPAGLDIKAVMRHFRETGGLQGFAGGQFLPNSADCLAVACDVVIPAALEGVITRDNAAHIKARIVLELANGPTTPDADEILFGKGVVVIPDFLANAGGVTVSYFEQVQNTYNFYWPLNEIHARLDERMTSAFTAVYDMYKKEGVNMRVAAYMVAVKRVAEAMHLRGWV
jgi:glutamate dehydrogenase (NAD(P)+)